MDEGLLHVFYTRTVDLIIPFHADDYHSSFRVDRRQKSTKDRLEAAITRQTPFIFLVNIAPLSVTIFEKKDSL